MKVVATNKKARHEYSIDTVYRAGIVLEGSEVKSIRQNGLSLNGCFVFVENTELFLKNCYIAPYDKATAYIPDSRRSRKLLLNRSEIEKIITRTKEKGFTIIPLQVYFVRGMVKIDIALAKGKKLFDKRNAMKEADIKREIDRELKDIG